MWRALARSERALAEWQPLGVPLQAGPWALASASIAVA